MNYTNTTTPMTIKEKQAVVSLSTVMALRMIGLFMVLPVFTLYAQNLHYATPALIGLCIGIYGLTQALFQIPFGWLSDYWGRKSVIILGLIIFSIGSLIAGLTSNIYLLIVGRLLQGSGAIGSTSMAAIADLTREDQRTKAMAITGISIGGAFTLALLLGPFLTQWLTVNYLFFLASLMGLLAIFLTTRAVPDIVHVKKIANEQRNFLQVLLNPNLFKLNAGIFILHMIFTASFMALPLTLQRASHLNLHQQWKVFLPCLLLSLLPALFIINLAEKKQKIKSVFFAAILTITIAELFLFTQQFKLCLIGLTLFFLGFSILESFLPSLVSRIAPPHLKGSGLGLYSCSQFLGIFMGGLLGGWLLGNFGLTSIYLSSALLALFWFAISLI